MASALSPTALAASKDSGPLSSREIGEHIKYYQQAHKAIVRITALVNRLPSTQALKIGNHSIRRSDASKYSQAYVSQLGDLRKMFGKRRAKRAFKDNNQLNSLFYVSDQLVSFYEGANLGPLDPESPKGSKLSNELELLTKHHMTTSSILTSLYSRYIDVNKLKDKGGKGKPTSGRYLPDSRMKKSFSDTKYMLFGEDLSKRKIAPSARPEKILKIKDHISQSKKSAISKVSSRRDKKTDEPLYDPSTGLSYTTMMIFNNYYRVPTELLNEDERESLQDPDVIDLSKTLQQQLSTITEWNKKQKA